MEVQGPAADVAYMVPPYIPTFVWLNYTFPILESIIFTEEEEELEALEADENENYLDDDEDDDEDDEDFEYEEEDN